MTPILEARSLTKRFRREKVIKDVSLDIFPSQIVGLIGPNGAGKTTLLRLLCGLIVPDSGEIAYHGETKGKAFDAAKARIGATINAPSLYPNLSAQDNLKAYALGRGLAIDNDAIRNAIQAVGLENHTKPVKNFSLGMKQRLSLATALYSGCEVVLLDEPFNGLDPLGLKQIEDQICSINREKGVAFVISSHNLPELEELCDRFVFLEAGRIVKTFYREELAEKEQRIVSFFSSDSKRCLDFFREKGIAYEQKDNRYFLVCNDDQLVLLESLKQSGISPEDVSITKESLMHLYSHGRISDE